MTKPITPLEVIKKKTEGLPPQVIEVFNELIAGAFYGRTAKVRQRDAVQRIASRLDIGEDEVYRRHLLDVEPIFKGAGWKVEYDKPGYNESYPAIFTFTAPAYRGRGESADV